MMFKKLSMAPATIVLIWLGACSALEDAGSPQLSQGAFVDQREIVALVADGDAQNRMQIFAASTGYTLREVTQLGSLDLIMLSFDMPEGTTGQEAIAELEAAVAGSTVGVNHAYREQAGSSPASGLSYANAMLNWPEAGCQAVVRMGMIDTGIDAAAAGLSNAQVIEQSFITGTAGSNQHGTEVASVLVDPTRVRNATLFNAAVIEQTVDAGHAAGADTLIKALDWLIEEDVKVVNISLAGPFNKLLDLAVANADERGLTMVAAVGNGGRDDVALYPAAFGPVIAVTAVDAASDIYRLANRGPHVDIAAPGVDILANAAQGPRFVSGTSIAAPFVTARIATDTKLANANADDVRDRLAANSRDLGPVGQDSIYGSGLMQAAATCSR